MLQRFRFLSLMLLLLLAPIALTSIYYVVNYKSSAQVVNPFPPGFLGRYLPLNDNRAVYLSKNYSDDNLRSNSDSDLFPMTWNNTFTVDTAVIPLKKPYKKKYGLSQFNIFSNRGSFALMLYPLEDKDSNIRGYSSDEWVQVDLKLSEYTVYTGSSIDWRNPPFIKIGEKSKIRLVKNKIDINNLDYRRKDLELYINDKPVRSYVLNEIKTSDKKIPSGIGVKIGGLCPICALAIERHYPIETAIDYIKLTNFDSPGRNRYYIGPPLALWNFSCNINSSVPNSSSNIQLQYAGSSGLRFYANQGQQELDQNCRPLSQSQNPTPTRPPYYQPTSAPVRTPTPIPPTPAGPTPSLEQISITSPSIKNGILYTKCGAPTFNIVVREEFIGRALLDQQNLIKLVAFNFSSTPQTWSDYKYLSEQSDQYGRIFTGNIVVPSYKFGSGSGRVYPTVMLKDQTGQVVFSKIGKSTSFRIDRVSSCPN